MNNKIIVIGIVFILLFTINLTLNNSHASLNAIYQVPIILVNDENVSTSNPFQQMIQLNESNYKGYIIYNRSFANFEFVYNNGTVIPAWIESNNSEKLTIWLKINSIPALSSKTIYLDIFPENDNLLNASGKNGIGEAPQLSKIYGQYDDGASVFNNYWNFAGTSLPSGWVEQNQSYSVSNALNILPSSVQQVPEYIGYDSPIPVPNIVDSYVTQWAGYGGSSNWGYVELGEQETLAHYTNAWNAIILEPGAPQWSYDTQYGTPVSIATPSPGIFSEFYTPSVTGFYTNYSLTASISTYSVPSALYIFAMVQNTTKGTLTIQWMRTRAYPPNGVMPSVTFGSLTSITRISKLEEMNIHTKIYALNLSLPQEWGIYGFFNYSIYGKDYSISISNLTNNYYLNLSINYNFSIFNNTTLFYNLSLYAYKLQDYIAINHLNYKGRLNVTTTQKEYNLSLIHISEPTRPY